MKSVQINNYGDNEVVEVNEDVVKPHIESNQVLVEIYAAAINPFDIKLKQGEYKDFINLNFPATLGGDLAGTVAEIGSDVTGFSKGQKVYGMANAAGGQGSFAEFSPVNSSQLSDVPSSTDFIGAAALPLAALSAYQALVEHIDLQPGQKILIHGGAGGIGTMAIQIASHIGAEVYTTAESKDHDYVISLGATQAIDYTQQDFSTELSELDAVFDTVGGETTVKSYMVLKNSGSLVSMLSPADEMLVAEKNIKYTQQMTEATQDRLQKIAELVDSGKLKVIVDKIFSLNDTAAALEYQESGHPKGKVVLQIK